MFQNIHLSLQYYKQNLGFQKVHWKQHTVCHLFLKSDCWKVSSGLRFLLDFDLERHLQAKCEHGYTIEMVGFQKAFGR